jgi:hypothetical protein
MSKSLILAEEAESDDEQLFLFSGHKLPKIDRSRLPFEFTGERLFRDRPDIYNAVVELLADRGVSLRMIVKHCHVSMNTIRAVAARERIPIDAQRSAIADTMAFGLRLATEQIIEKLPSGNLKDSAIAANILSTNLQVQRGEPIARIEVGLGGNLFERFQRFHDELVAMARAKTIKATVIEPDEPETGLGGTNSVTKGLPASDVASPQIEPHYE